MKIGISIWNEAALPRHGSAAWNVAGKSHHLTFGALDEPAARRIPPRFRARNCGVNVVLSGNGRFTTGDNSFALAAGWAFIRRPGEDTELRIARGSGWREWYCTIDPVAAAHLAATGLLPLGREPRRLAAPQVRRFGQCLRDLAHGRVTGPAGLLAVLGWLQSIADDRALPGRDERLRRAVELLEADVRGLRPLADIARAVGLGAETFRKEFRARVGVPPGRFRIQRRMELARELLRNDPRSIKAIAETLGYPDAFAFSAQFRSHVGESPRDFRRRR